MENIGGTPIMLTLILQELARKKDYIETLTSRKPNWITKVDDQGVYVETESSREKHSKGEKDKPWDLISHEFIKEAWEEFTTTRTATASNFVKTKGRSSFLMAFFGQLPFVKQVSINNSTAIQLIEFQTDDIPCEQFHKVMAFLDEILEGIYDPKYLSQQITDQNLYRIKSRARQDLRLLGFLNKDNEINHDLLEEYRTAPDKIPIIRRQITQHPYFQIALNILQLLQNRSKSERRKALVELGKLIMRNSQGEI
jgi:hypothetical protein